jgi:hypothetical protein
MLKKTIYATDSSNIHFLLFFLSTIHYIAKKKGLFRVNLVICERRKKLNSWLRCRFLPWFCTITFMSNRLCTVLKNVRISAKAGISTLARGE